MNFPWSSLATLLVLALLLWTGIKVAGARGRYGIKAPAVSGHEMFERAYRVQMNTLENTLLLLPSLWLFAISISDIWAGVVGIFWCAARIWYAKSYANEPSKRGPAFTAGMAAFAVLWLGSAWGVIRVLMH